MTDTQDQRIHAIIYSNDSRTELAERIVMLEDENAKLRELIFDMLVDEERGHNDDDTYYEHVRLAKELGVEFRG